MSSSSTAQKSSRRQPATEDEDFKCRYDSYIDNNNKTFKHSTGSLYADCVGDCKNSLAKLIAAIVENAIKRILNKERVAIINKYFTFYDSKMSKYLLRLMQISRCNLGTDEERALMADLLNNEVDMCNEEWPGKLITVLCQFMDNKYPRKVMILQKLAQKSCKRPPVMDVFEEIEENLKDSQEVTFEPRITYYQILKEKRLHKNHQIMVDAGHELSNNEMFAVILYTGLAPVSAAFRKSHRGNCISCKWRQTFTHLGSAIKKLHRVFVCGKDIRKEFFGGFQEPELFHGIPLKINQDEKQPLRFRTITSLSTSDLTSLEFAKAGGCLLHLTNISESLSNGELIAAPVDWLSEHFEREWCLLPTDFLEWKFIGTSSSGVDHYTVFKYESKSFIPSDDIEEYFQPIEAYFGNIPSDERLKASEAIAGIGIAIGTFSKFRCEHCKIRSRLIDYTGHFWEGESNCPCCRKYVLGAVQDEYEKIPCHACGIYSRKLYWKFPFPLIEEHKKDNFYGVLCPHCQQPHKKSLRRYKMTDVEFRASVRRDFEIHMRDAGPALFGAAFKESDIEKTVDKLVPKLYDANNAKTDVIQMAFMKENPRFTDFLPLLLNTPFGEKFAANSLEWFGHQLIPQNINLNRNLDAIITGNINVDNIINVGERLVNDMDVGKLLTNFLFR